MSKPLDWFTDERQKLVSNIWRLYSDVHDGAKNNIFFYHFFASKKCSIRNDFKRNAAFPCFVVPVKYLQVLSQLSARCTTSWMKSAEKQNLFHAYFHPISILKFSSIFWLFEKKNVHNVSLYTPNCQQTAQPSEQNVKITKIRFIHIFGKNK